MNEWLYTGSGSSRYSLKYGSAKVIRGFPPVGPKTLRFKFSNASFNPTTRSGLLSNNWTWSVYDSSEGIWDLTVTSATQYWSNMFSDVFTTGSTNMGTATADIIDGNLNGVIGCYYTFARCASLTSVRVRETSALEYIEGMFDGCRALTSVSLFDTSNVQSMFDMFDGCESLRFVPLFNTSNVTNMRWMFHDCLSLPSVPLFDTHNVTNMENMFSACKSLTTVPLFDTSNVTNMQDMFAGGGYAMALSSLPLFDTSKVTKMNAMLQFCGNLTTVPNFDTRNVTNMDGMFFSCSGLVTAPSFNTTKVTDMGIMFHGCSSLRAVPLYDTGAVTTMSGMFKNCTNVESGALALYQQASSQATPPTYFNECFLNCGSNTTTGAAELAQIPTSWGGTMSA